MYSQAGSEQLPVPFRTAPLKTPNSDVIVQTEVPLLPATFRKNYRVEPVNADIGAFLEIELNVRRLNEIHSWLWLVGLPTAPRPFHYQIVKGREIMVTEQLDLHLIWSSSKSSSILLKPLPRFLFCQVFWQMEICPRQHVYKTALGFLLSYVALIEREVDYNLAIFHGLIPKEITWAGWLALMSDIICTLPQAAPFNSALAPSVDVMEGHIGINERFIYGELRLGRLNWIYRLVMGEIRGYLSGCTTYGSFMRENINSLIIWFAYTTIVLSAMQVGLSTQSLGDNHSFSMASIVFSVFSILAPLACIVAITAIMTVMIIINLVRTLNIRKQKRRRGVKV